MRRGSPASRRRPYKARSARPGCMDLGDLRLGAVEHRVVEGTREVERRVPELLEARRAGAALQRLDPHVRQSPPAGAAPSTARRSPAQTARASPPAAGPRPRSSSSRPGSCAHGLCSIESHTASATRPPGRSTRRVSTSAASGIGHQHVAPAAQHRVDACHRQVDPFGIEHLELDVAQAQRVRPRTGAREHRLGLVGDDHPAHRRHQLGGQHARLAQACRQFEHALAGLRRDRVHHPVRDGRAEFADRFLLARPAGRRLFPVSLASRWGLGSKLI